MLSIKKKCLLFLTVLVLMSLGQTTYASSRSWKSWLIEQYFWLKGDKSYYKPQDDVDFKKYLDESQAETDKGYSLTNNDVYGQLKSESLEGMQVYSWNDHHNPKQKTIFYLHGGSYLNNPTSYHISMLKELSQTLDAKIVFPIYPKTPRNTYYTVMPKVVNVYRHFHQQNQENFFLMGDSAGGGLALGLGHALNYEAKPYTLLQPKRIILLSPWLDVTMSHPEIKDYEKTDPILSAWGLKRVGEYWARSKDLMTHEYVSPKNGRTDHLAPISLFTGTREIFYPDIRDYAKLLKERNHDVTYYEKAGMNHVYPIYPISEANEAKEQIRQEIIKSST
ncbi:hypothetical protein HMPREF9318_01275 [Streptococcus urinalis FB127-CNA-2]|uniref:Hydrolase, alpha/beta domain protein n=1 Tax=Streptococcus urinalis 2285-97 TaxID=764291 RepID=G5KCC5_9STRE|nr:alpha/beta hydrolase [Streptococcus urinalis]EHJ56515.1 hydrolase, alpha/beta domain protein [Streptococcus urinalis 2285-97]EKS19753.1 hypothetical protein HMPREF9318_01275 [Streptococcus urinalis FB127-CNA-2]VEF31330.1 putative esterase [Streptococcus urinalis]